MKKCKQNFEKCISKIQKTQDVSKFRRKITEIKIIDKLTCEIMENKPLEFYEWYIFQ